MKAPPMKAPPIPSKHADRNLALASLRGTHDARRQEFLWERERKLKEFEDAAAKEIDDLTARFHAYEEEREAVVAREARTALRSAFAQFGNAPRDGAIAFRNTWQAFVARVTEEFGAEPNYLLLIAAVLPSELEDTLGSQIVVSGNLFSGDITQAIVTLAGDSIARAQYALQCLEISVEEAARMAEGEPDPTATRAILQSATHASVVRRVELGDRLAAAIAEAHGLISRLAEAARERQATNAANERSVFEVAKDTWHTTVAVARRLASDDADPGTKEHSET